MGRTKMRKTAIFMCDTHVPLHSQPAMNVLYKAIKLVKPDMVIHGGDTGEWDAVSSWKYMKKKRPPLEYIIADLKKDALVVNVELDKLDRACEVAGVKEKIMLEGNHEKWLDNFVEEHDYLPGYTPQKIMKLEKRGWDYLPYGEYLTIGELNFYHGGHCAGLHHARQHLINLGVNIVYGHNHSVQRASIAGLHGVRAAFCMGCLKSCQGENNKWLKGRKMNWSQAFGIVYWNPDGTFRVETVDITSGITHVWGKKIDGNK
jgi:predicted phosphodiesterase